MALGYQTLSTFLTDLGMFNVWFTAHRPPQAHSSEHISLWVPVGRLAVIAPERNDSLGSTGNRIRAEKESLAPAGATLGL